MTYAACSRRWFRLFLLPLVLPLGACCEENVLTYDQAQQRVDKGRVQLRRLTVQRSVVEKKLALERRLAPTAANPPEYLRRAQQEYDARADALDQEIAAERGQLQNNEGLATGIRQGG